jgi:TATA-box binding protein (TBP) (component of TFIID and TFIIIB)
MAAVYDTEFIKNIDKYIFTEFSPGALQVQAKLSNVDFHEEDLIFAMQPRGNIIKMECNYGVSYNTEHTIPPPPKKTSNRGRKPKDKMKNKKNRKTQGNGMSFSSQMSFWVIFNNNFDKIYKVKVFRNGTVKIPGILCPELTDAYKVIDVIKKGLSACLMEDIQLVEIHATMRNYKFKINIENTLVHLPTIKQKFIESVESKNPLTEKLFQIKYNSERYPGLIVKFSTPTLINKDKQVTVKMFQSGKVNIDGANQKEQAWYYYNVLNQFYLQYADDILYTPVVLDDSSSESDGEE